MYSWNSGQNDWKVILVGRAWQTWALWTVCVQGMQHNVPWLWWNCSAGNSFSRHLLLFLLCFCRFVKIQHKLMLKHKLQLQLFKGMKKLSAKVYWMWKVWFICRNAKLAWRGGLVFSWVVSLVWLADKYQPSSGKELEWEGIRGLGCLQWWQES